MQFCTSAKLNWQKLFASTAQASGSSANVAQENAENAGGSDERPEEPRQENAGCPSWPHISQPNLKKYRKKHSEQKVQEYIFLYSCDHQCIDCCLRSIEEYDIDPRTCVSSHMDGLGWAGRDGKTVSAEFAEFWAGLTS